MSLTSYRAAPPRANSPFAGKHARTKDLDPPMRAGTYSRFEGDVERADPGNGIGAITTVI
jgi:hypothetical protein